MTRIAASPEFAKRLELERIALEKMRESEEALIANDARTAQAKSFKKVQSEGDIDGILELERMCLLYELEYYSNSAAMTSSLKAAIEGLDATLDLLAKSRNPARYREVDESFRTRKNRADGLPIDEARQFFASHEARLRNLDKARLDASEKELINCRLNGIRIAMHLYKDLQREALNSQKGHA